MRRIRGTIEVQHWNAPGWAGAGTRYLVDLELTGEAGPGDILGALQEELEKKTGKDLGGEDA